MKRIRELFGRHEFHAVVFCISLVLFSWPLVSSADLSRVSSTFIYLFGGWAVVIFLQFVISSCVNSLHGSEKSDETEP